MRVLTVVGARPQFVKAAVVSSAFARRDGVTERIVHTGQHFDAGMSDVFFDELAIPAPAHRLGVSGGTHGVQTARMLEALEPIVIEEGPDALLVYGDTNSTLAGGLVAAKLHVPVVHVEAGLRSFNRRMPEEVNRVVVDHLSSLLCAPTETAVTNLANEGITGTKVVRTGDVMVDSTRLAARLAEKAADPLPAIGVDPHAFILSTVHRAENTDDPARLAAIVGALAIVAETIPVVLPLHPRTRQALERDGALERVRESLRVIEPVGSLEMARLESAARLIATDSGGVQKEAFLHGVPCVTLRDETEWVELVELGWNVIAPPQDADELAATIMASLDRRGQRADPYGDGRAAEHVVDAVLARLGS